MFRLTQGECQNATPHRKVDHKPHALEICEKYGGGREGSSSKRHQGAPRVDSPCDTVTTRDSSERSSITSSVDRSSGATSDSEDSGSVKRAIDVPPEGARDAKAPKHESDDDVEDEEVATVESPPPPPPPLLRLVNVASPPTVAPPLDAKPARTPVGSERQSGGNSNSDIENHVVGGADDEDKMAPQTWHPSNPLLDSILITDVTTNCVTITVRECSSGDGFFKERNV
ncbi:PREDICTED: chromobox protein homolog 2-like [Priapulus caudatus]|uniref:Chromobox protein homolog 2-like n=1 Tax=Priapulus caudatus TaxID=37621 RepID=A0ABM1EHN2_PRICU|nr:PREDICTED: chromobox protein homolog 2-like [Priapulus caudatus]